MKKEGTITALQHIRDLLEHGEPDLRLVQEMVKHLLLQGPCERELAEIKESALLILERLTLPILAGEREKQLHVSRMVRTLRKQGGVAVVELLMLIDELSPWVEEGVANANRGEPPPHFAPDLAMDVLRLLGMWEADAPDALSTKKSVAEGWFEVYRQLGRIISREQRAHAALAREKKALQDAVGQLARDLVASSRIIGRKSSTGETWVDDLTSEFLARPAAVMESLLAEEQEFLNRVQELETALIRSQEVVTQFQTLLRRAERALMDTRDETLVDIFTGLPNRFAFMAWLAQVMEPEPGDSQGREPFAIIFMQVDEYQEMIRDLGRDRTNRVMALMGSKIATLPRSEDHLARWSEDTFALLSPGADATIANTLASMLHASLHRTSIELSDALVTVRLGYGVVVHHADMTAERLLELAELAAKAALQEGGVPIRSAEVTPPRRPSSNR
ncbi:MAG: diguanylate cyclase [Magnetococcus sp. YQC-5]